MKPGIEHEFKRVHDLWWPQSDTDANAVILDQVVDVEQALQYVTDFTTCVQAGGNVGVWPKYLAKRFQEVYTFEPERANFQCLVMNCPEHNIFAFPYALGAAKGHASMDYPEGKKNMGACCVKEGQGTLIDKIDNYRLAQVGLIQLDVEGMEHATLLGAMETIKRWHPVLMLEDKGLSDKYGAPAGWSRSFMADQGYYVANEIHRDVILVWRPNNA